jgi:hypothetical protein
MTVVGPSWIGRVALVGMLLYAPLVAAEKPWEADVAPATREEAQTLFEEGNLLFAQQAHAPALAKYQAAIALWDHPLIRLNKAVTELRLDRILEAADDLDAAMRFGKEPFTDNEYRNLREQQQLIATKVGHIEATCTEPGMQVLLDGEPWLSCPAKASRRVLIGRHALLGQKQGATPIARQLTISAGMRAVETIELVRNGETRSSDPGSSRPLWRNPWLWGGAALLTAGIATSYRVYASRDQDRLDELTATSASHEFADVEAVLERGDRRARWSTTFYVGAGALALTTVAFALLPQLAPAPDDTTQARLSVTPNGIGVTWGY